MVILISERLERCGAMMKAAEVDVLLLTKPSNMFYLTGDGRLCAYAMVIREGSPMDCPPIESSKPEIWL
jgi:hypothetical protein